MKKYLVSLLSIIMLVLFMTSCSNNKEEEISEEELEIQEETVRDEKLLEVAKRKGIDDAITVNPYEINSQYTIDAQETYQNKNLVFYADNINDIYIKDNIYYLVIDKDFSEIFTLRCEKTIADYLRNTNYEWYDDIVIVANIESIENVQYELTIDSYNEDDFDVYLDTYKTTKISGKCLAAVIIEGEEETE